MIFVLTTSIFAALYFTKKSSFPVILKKLITEQECPKQECPKQ
jgi:hypothetical protein